MDYADVSPWKVAIFLWKTLLCFWAIPIIVLTPIGWIGYAIYYFFWKKKL